MKKIILITVVFSLWYGMYAQIDNFSPLFYLSCLPEEQYKTFIYKTENIILSCMYDSPEKIHFDPKNSGEHIRNYQIKIDAGYRYYLYRLHAQHGFPSRQYRDFLLEGKGMIIIHQQIYEPIPAQEKLTDWEKKVRGTWAQRKYAPARDGHEHEGWGNVYIIDDGIKSIKASSYLIESNGIAYTAENIKNKLYTETTDDPVNILYDSRTQPWAEGTEGYGIGEWLEVEFKYASDEIQILNGFVDFNRKHLYMDNSRVKTIVIESENPKFIREYILEDVVKYELIELPAKTTNIRITIKDVYPGKRWKDTCLSSIVVTNPDLSSYESERERVIECMKDNGVWQIIEEFKKPPKAW